MNILTFPGLGLEFELNRVAFTLFGKEIYWYGIIIAFGFLLAVGFGFRFMADRFAVNKDKLMDMLFFAVPAAVIGARIYYVLFYLDLYVDAAGRFDWGRAVAIWDGGLAIYGGVIGAVLAAVIYCRVRKEPFWSYADVGAYGLLIGQLVGRWGNFVNIEAYGGVTMVPWRMCSTKIAQELLTEGQIGVEAYQQILDGTLGVHPTFLYESLWNLLGLILLILLAKKGRKFNGQMFLGYVAWYGVGRAVIEGLRTDSLYFFQTGLRVSQLLGILSAVAAVVVAIIRYKTAGPATPPVTKSTSTEGDEDGSNQD